MAQSVVEHGIAALAVMGQTWEDSRPEVSDSESIHFQGKWAADQAEIGRAFAVLLHQGSPLDCAALVSLLLGI
ncbi:hypothetical protein L195_g043773 [Trifolium pratense]|uniref:Uncharacterized protein n=1 Tax=Trifolium pratense TaxID=57577 RepID=A0A2K3MA85_TRIPR|nr:hypothetical protein L195_g043773 [Trifolium pratense]